MKDELVKFINRIYYVLKMFLRIIVFMIFIVLLPLWCVIYFIAWVLIGNEVPKRVVGRIEDFVFQLTD